MKSSDQICFKEDATVLCQVHGSVLRNEQMFVAPHVTQPVQPSM